MNVDAAKKETIYNRLETLENRVFDIDHDYAEATEELAMSLVAEHLLSSYVFLYLPNVWFNFALTLNYKDCQAACHKKSKNVWWRVAVGWTDNTDGVVIVIAQYSTKLHSRKHIDSRWNPLSTHQDRERTAEHLFCERLQNCTLILHQVIDSIPTRKGQQVLWASLRWYSMLSDIIEKLHYQDFYRGGLQ